MAVAGGGEGLDAGLDESGWLAGAQRIPSPNSDARPDGTQVELVVIHAVSLPPQEFGGDGIARLFTNTLDPELHPYYRQIHTLRVSAHFLVRRDGSVVQFVPCEQRAWHAGASRWRGREHCNDFSIGIELEGCDALPFEPAQYDVLSLLLLRIMRRYPISDVVGHADVAPGRKTDPGPHFDWTRLRALLAAQRR